VCGEITKLDTQFCLATNMASNKQYRTQ